jgi:Cu2+-exporting ATPase
MLPILPFIILGGSTCAAVLSSYKKRNQKKKLSCTSDNSTDKTLLLLQEEKQINRDLSYSVAALALSSAGFIGLPLLALISIPIEVYLFIPFIKRAYQELFKDKKLGIACLDTIIAIVLLGTGYFFAIALFFIFYNSSQKLLLKTQKKSHDELVNILGEKRNYVWLLKEGIEIEIAFENVHKGDVVIAQAGEMIAVDGFILSGISSIDQHVLTGESQPIEKTIGDSVFAGTFVLSGKIYIEVDKAGKETVAEKLGEILNNTADFKFDLETKGEKYAHQGVLPTLVLSAITLPLLGTSSAATILLAAFGYNMRIIAPISVLNALKITSKQGVLVKDGRALERLPKVDTIVFDKTGTLTQEQPHIGNIYSFSNLYDKNQVLTFAACAEYKQSHPIAKAILEEAKKRQLSLDIIEDASYNIGYGIKVNLEGHCIRVGSLQFMKMEKITLSEKIHEIQLASNRQGYSLIYIASNNELIGIIELHPTIRPNIKEVIKQLHQRNLKTYIISGDNDKPTQYLAEQLGIDDYFAEILPEDKANLITQLQAQGKTVCFVGDGINDAIALKQADVSISLNGASSIAKDTAQIILMDQGLSHLPWLFEFSNKLDKNLHQGLVSTIIPGIICVGGVYLFHTGVIVGTIIYNIGLLAGVSNAMLIRDKSFKKL